MELKQISWKNIGPFGNKLQTIDFPDKGGLWIVVGQNGAGKSFFVSLPKILYYGRLDRLKKDDIANRANRHGFIQGVDQIAPDTLVTIERHFAPTDLIVYKNGEDIGRAGISNYQEYIDNEVTGLPYHIFSNIISLSVNDFKSFILMTPHDKRIIIDKLFAMEIINQMNELVKKDLRDIKINIDLFDREIKSLKTNIDIAVKELQKLKTQSVQDNTETVKKLTEQLNLYRPKLEDGYKKKKLYENKRDEINKSYTMFSQQKIRAQHDLQHLKTQIKLFDQEQCPTCSTPFNDSRFDSVKEQLIKDQNDKTEYLELLLKEEEKYVNALKQIKEGLTSINNFIIQIDTTCRTLESEMNKLQMNKPKEFISIQNIISDNSSKLTTIDEEKTMIDENYKYLAILEQLYSDTGVKKKILENYIPTLNREIAYTLNELHFPYNLTFNTDFEPELQHLGNDISVESLSTGERKRVDLAVLISIIRMLKKKYPKLNIFMLDEVLSSIDSNGIYDIVGLLQRISKEMKINIFVINHSPLPIEHFDFSISVEKNAGFSDLQIEKLNQEET